MFNKNVLFAGVACLTAFACGQAQAQLFNVDFAKTNTVYGGVFVPVTPTHSGAAAIGSAGDFWNSTDTEQNNFTDLEDILDAGSNPSTVDVIWSDELQSSENDDAIEFGPVFNPLMEDYAFTHPNTTATITISGLAANTDYSLYLYGVPDNNGQQTTFSVVGANEGAQNVTEGNIADGTDLATPDDYVIFTGNTGAGGQIVYTQTGTGSSSGFSGSNGFQLQLGSPCNPGDTDGDGDIDTADLTTSIQNFTGAGGSTIKTCEEGDTDDDGDVDTADLTFSIQNFTGAQAANAGVPDLVYDPATGNVTIDADGADVISFSLQAGPFNAADFSELPAGLTDNIASQIGWTSFNLFSGLTGTANLGAILPAGLDQAGLEAALTTASYGLALAGGGGGGRLDLIIPEPASMVLMGLGAVALVRRRRAA